MTGRKAKVRNGRRGRPAAPRNPFVRHLRRRGKALEDSARSYKRRPKHLKGIDRDDDHGPV